MNTNTVFSFVSLINTVIIVCTAIGGFFVIKHARKAETIKIQKDVIDALQDQISAIERDVKTLEKENTRLRFVLETVQEALKKRGIIVTIDGDLVTITDSAAGTSIVRRRPPHVKGAKPAEEAP